jgi:SAM-dependent methyltransferase
MLAANNHNVAMSETWTPPKGIDPDRPSPARVYDCYLGGTHNFAADRAVAAQAIAAMPQLPEIMRANRAFLRRAVRMVAGEGIDQFLDLGSGIPTEGTVHEVARQVRPGARVVYVDVDPVAVIHSRSILEGDPQSGVVQADLLAVDHILTDPVVTGLLDLDRPVCLLLVAVLHFLPDSPELRAALHRYRDALAPGSYLVVSHATAEAQPRETAKVADLYTKVSKPLIPRDRTELAELLDGWDLVDPGLAQGPDWRPDPADPPPPGDVAMYATLAGVARKP